ncbi:unnamed protein product [Meloidogyne enterolobii]|uniref:Uncharacterized protein n=1 Tax=Meloidogyne enterolobii TaxID=390850 RepID=A0ACB0XTE5_MELEN
MNNSKVILKLININLREAIKVILSENLEENISNFNKNLDNVVWSDSYENNKKQNLTTAQYNTENIRRKRRSRNSNGKLIREILKAIFGEKTVKKLDTLIGYLAIGFLYFIYIAGPIYEYIYRIHCTFPDLTWFRNLRPFGGGNGQNNGGNQVVVQQPQIQPQPVQPMLPQMHPNLVHHIRPQVPPQILPPQIRPNLQQQMGPHFNPQIQPQNIIHNPHPHQRPPIPWFQQANSFTNISYTSMPSSSDPMSFYNRSYNPQPGQPSGYQPHILLEDSDDERS